MNSRKILFLFLAVLFVCFGASTPALFAQGTDLGTIQGTVTNTGGAVVSNAQVTITNTQTKVAFPFKTDSRGFFTAPALQPGHYDVTVTAPGFGVTTLNGVLLLETATMNLNPVMHVSSTTTTVNVSVSAALINTENQTL